MPGGERRLQGHRLGLQHALIRRIYRGRKGASRFGPIGGRGGPSVPFGASPSTGKPSFFQPKIPSSSTAVFGKLRLRSSSTTAPEAWWGQAQ